MSQGGNCSGRRAWPNVLWPRSLRGRLVLIPVLILFLGLVATVGAILLDARARIAAEITSGMQMGHDLATTALRNVANASSPALALERLAQDLPHVRHVQFEIIPADGSLFHGSRLQPGEVPPRARPWLARLLAPPPMEQTFPVLLHGNFLGEVLLRSNSADEIEEIVGEVELFSATLTALCLLIVGTLLWTVRRSLRPVQLLAAGFNRLERGEYQPMERISVAELSRIGDQFNHLAASLRRLTDDNHLLIDKLLSLQEQERKELAAELHDEVGPTLFGIRAEAACIIRALPKTGQGEGRIRAHAAAIAELTDGIQKLNTRMLDRLRPLVLEQMGLCQALQQLVSAWRSRYGQISWTLEIQHDVREPTESVSLVLYRVAQEAVTNAVRHAQASRIEIQLARATDNGSPPATAGFQNLSLEVRDDGRGLPGDLRYGFGLLGMAERIRQVGGTLAIGNRNPSGVVLRVSVPGWTQDIPAERTHAHIAD